MVLTFPCAGRGPKEWHLTESKVAEYRQSFPGFDVMVEIRKSLQWIRDNPAKRKTAAGMPAFLSRWLSKVQNRGSPRQPNERMGFSGLKAFLEDD